MKKYNSIKISLLFFAATFVFIVTISPSCSTRKNHRKLDIERLFMQTTKPEIAFTNSGGLEGVNGSRSVSEEVTFTRSTGDLGSNEVLADEINHLDTTKTYRLSGVVVKAKSNFATERDGRVHVDFDIIAPTDILDPYWRLTFAPMLIDGDSITPLDTVYVTGEGFRDKQMGDYEAYQDFLNTIVDPSAYDSLFVNWKSMNKEIYKVQRRNYNDYKRAYDLMMDYDNWKKLNEMEFLRMEAIARRHKKHMQARYWRQSDKKALRQVQKNNDTLGIYNQYMEKYKKDYTNYLKRQFSFDWLDSIGPDINIHKQKDSIMRRSYIPKKYREIHLNGLTMRDLKAKAFTKEDSARIAKRHYLIDEIVLNDMNIERKGEIFKDVVEFPIPESSESLRLDTVISGDDDFIYSYKQPWKIDKKTKKLDVVLVAMVEGIDKSTFVFPVSDTLSYFIASLSQLADDSQVTERKMLYKSMVDNQKLYPDYRTKKSYQVKDIKNPDIFDKIVEAYRLYNNEADLVVDSVSIRAYTDLAGLWHENYELANNRAKEVADYFKQKGIRNAIPKTSSGEDWPTLAREVQSHQSLLYRQAILDSLTNAIYPDMTEENIRKEYPEDYKIIRDQIYPKLTRFEVTLHINRPGIEENTVQETYREDYAEGIKLLREKEYMGALEKLAKYADYNTALALVCLGYNDKAQEVLESLPETGRNEYLLAIVKSRKEKTNEAAKHLQKACQLSPELYSRIRLDSEVRELADQLNLWDTLNN